MTNTPENIDCKLSRVELQKNNAGTNVVITLTGHEMALAQAEGMLTSEAYVAKLGRHFTERDAKTKSLKIFAGIKADPDKNNLEEKAANVVEAVYDITKCRLGGMDFHASAVAVSENTDAFYSPAVTFVPHIDRADKKNMVGVYSMEVINRKSAHGTGMISDPRAEPGTLRLLHFTQTLPTEDKAEYEAEELLKKLKKDFGIYVSKPTHLMLAGLHTELLDGSSGRNPGSFIIANSSEYAPSKLSVTTATLNGSEEQLDRAQQLLAHIFPSKMFKLDRHDTHLDVLYCGERKVDAGVLLKNIHMKTGCILPADLVASSTRDTDKGHAYFPCIEARVWDEVPDKARNTTGESMAFYVGMQIPQSFLSVPQDIPNKKQSLPARVVIDEPFATEADAHAEVTRLKNMVEARIERGEDPLMLRL